MINRNKLEHIFEYAKQQRHIGQYCKIPPEDMVEIMERLLSACNSPAIPDGYVMVPVEPTKEILDEFDSIIDYGAEDSVDAWHRLLAAAPQSPGSEPATVPGKWIPVSEQMPERGDWLVTDGCDFDVQLFNGEQFIPGFVWEDKITHWMPLPAAPQEVK
ncbi:Eaa1 [Klebsiella pneumoniae]|nr:DUF551 domain-containing protein [Klebsiella pneumoniae]VGA26290.1 Eaa1 [Klebsiella pneumoniae]